MSQTAETITPAPPKTVEPAKEREEDVEPAKESEEAKSASEREEVAQSNARPMADTVADAEPQAATEEPVAKVVATPRRRTTSSTFSIANIL